MLGRFTSYDFKKMQRRSYYPQNQQIVSTITQGSSSMVPSSRPVTPNTIAGDGDLVRPDSVNGSAYDDEDIDYSDIEEKCVNPIVPLWPGV